MTDIINVGNGDTSYNTDSIAEALIASEVQDKIDNGEKTIEEDWHNVEKKPCGVCHGSGYDAEDKIFCMACEGSGSDVELHYGVSGMKMFAYVKQYGIDFFKEFCKACREAEAESATGVVKDEQHQAEFYSPFKLPTIIQYNFMAQGIPLDEMMKEPDGVKMIARTVAKFYPEFLTTNRINF